MREKEVSVAILGREGAGKTVYLSMLAYALEKGDSTQYSVRFGDPESRKYLSKQIARIAEEEHWPKTNWDSDVDISLDILDQDNQTVIRYRTTDLPGEILGDLFAPGVDGVIWHSEKKRSLAPYDRYVPKIQRLIHDSDLFMFLIDSSVRDDEEKRLWDYTGQDLMCSNVIDEIIERRDVSTPGEMPPVCFLFTKWDAFENQISDFQEHARRVLSTTLDAHGELLRGATILKCSAVGATKLAEYDNGYEKKRIHVPERPVEPDGVLDTLEWVIENGT